MKKNSPYRIKNSYKKRIQELRTIPTNQLLEYSNYLDSIIEYSKTVIGSVVALIIAIFVANYQKTIYPMLYSVIHTTTRLDENLLKTILNHVILILILLVIILLMLYLYRLSRLYREKSIVNYLLLSKKELRENSLTLSHRRKRRR